MKQFIQKTIITTGYKFISALLKFLLVIYITNTFGAAEYGAFTFAMSVFLFINLIFRYGFDIYVQKETALYETKKQQLSGIYEFLKLITVSSVSLIAVTVIVEMILYMFPNFLEPLRHQYLTLILWFSFIYAIMWLYTYYFRGIGEGSFSVFNLEIIFPILQMIFIFIFHSLKYPVYQTLILSFGIALIFTIMIYSFKIKDRLSYARKYAKSRLPNLSFHSVKNSYPFLLMSMSSMILTWEDIYVISYFESNESIGVYSVVTKIGMLLLFPSSAVYIFFANKVVEFMHRNEKENLRKYFLVGTLGLFMVSLIMFLLINFFNIKLLSIFGKEFSYATTVLLIYTFAQLVNASAGMFEGIFLMTDLKNVYLKINLFMIVVNFLLNVPMVYWWGIEGAAFATMMSVLITKAIQAWILNKNAFISVNKG